MRPRSTTMAALAALQVRHVRLYTPADDNGSADADTHDDVAGNRDPCARQARDSEEQGSPWPPDDAA